MMKKLWRNPRTLFSLLMGVCLVSMALGAYLTGNLCIRGALMQRRMLSPAVLQALLSLGGCALWETAWGAFFGLCRLLRTGQSAFCPQSERTLHIIGRCMGIQCLLILLQGTMALRAGAKTAFIAMPGLLMVFGGVSLVSHILRGLLAHAMMLEEEQEGVV